jgi:hypothetical protein
MHLLATYTNSAWPFGVVPITMSTTLQTHRSTEASTHRYEKRYEV